MTVNDVIKISAELIGDNGLKSYIASGAIVEGETAETLADKKQRLLSCYNLAICELAEEKLPLTLTETVALSGGKLYFYDLTKYPRAILSCEKDGVDVPFVIKNDRLEANATSLSVTYSYLPATANEDDDYAFLNSPLSGRVTAYAVAAEYLLIKGLFEEAVIFRSRFEEALKSCVPPRKIRRIRARGWY